MVSFVSKWVERWKLRDQTQVPERRNLPRAKRLERQILTMIAFLSISTGLWENFRQLWLEANNFTAPEVSNILSFGMIIGVVGITVVGKFIKMHQIKNLVTVSLMARFLNLLALFCVNGSGNTAVISLCIAVDITTSYIVLTSLYPLLTTVTKSNRAYSRRKLVEYLFRDVGILVGGILIGHQLGSWLFDYNGCLLVAAVFLVIAIIIMYQLDLETVPNYVPARTRSVIRIVMKNRVQQVYMIYNFLSSVSFYAAVGLKMLILTNMFDFTPSVATDTLLVVGLTADMIGIFAMKYFTPRNDYVIITLKFGLRLVAFTIAVLTSNPFLCFAAFLWALLSSTAYEDISDGYYINAVDNRHQLKYGTFRNIISYLGEAAGMFICGRMYDFGIAAILGVSAAILVVQLGVAYYLIYLRQTRGLDWRKR